MVPSWDRQLGIGPDALRRVLNSIGLVVGAIPRADTYGADDGHGGVTRIDRSTLWVQRSGVVLRCDAGHPQGLTRFGEHWLLATVRPETRHGELIVLSDDGTVVERRDVTRGSCFHPGGLDAVADGCFVAVAEYRPDSTTRVVYIDRSLGVTDVFSFSDHLGAIGQLPPERPGG